MKRKYFWTMAGRTVTMFKMRYDIGSMAREYLWERSFYAMGASWKTVWHSKPRALWATDQGAGSWFAVEESLALSGIVSDVNVVRPGDIEPSEVTYRIGKRAVSFFALGRCGMQLQFHWVAGRPDWRELCLLYPKAPLAQAYLIARDELLERGLIGEAS